MMTRTAGQEDSYPLTPIQHGMLYDHLRGERPGVNVEQIYGHLPDEVEAAALRVAWQRLAERHDVLRTSLRWEDTEKPVQVVHPQVEVPFRVEDLTYLGEEEQEERIREHMSSERMSGFDLSDPPLFRVRLFRLGTEEHVMIWTFHHVLMNGRSFPVALRELFEIYEARRENREPDLPEPVPHRRHVQWLREEYSGTDDEEFWRDLLTGFDAPTPLPYRPSAGRNGGDEDQEASSPGRGEVERRLSEAATDRIREMAADQEVTLGTAVQAAWGLLLARFADRDDVVFGATRAGRAASVEGADRSLGVYMNTVPVRVRERTGDSVGDLLRELRQQSLDVRPHEHARLVDVQEWSDVPASEPLFRSILVYDHESLGQAMRREGGEWEARDFRLFEDPGYPLVLYAYGEPELFLRLGYDPDLYDEKQAERLLRYVESLLVSLTREPGAEVADVDLLPTGERMRLLKEWNDTDLPAPDSRLEELFRRQARDTPDRVALVCGDAELTYGELDAWSDRLARELLDRGVGEGAIVGVCLSRSPFLVAALLAVHKAGAAYLPLDPSHPEKRLRYMLDDADASVVITDEANAGVVPDGVETIDRDRLSTGAFTRDGGAPDVAPVGESSDLAYVIFTSGSTGRPKGVMVEHRNVANFFRGMDDRIGGERNTLLATTSLSFDISVLELYWILCRGDEVVLLRGDATEALPGRTGDVEREGETAGLSFSLFFFGGDASLGEDRYGLLTEAARFADENGFEAIWTPERHFHPFGGPYPNPSVTGAALAAITDRLSIRAGSVVLPLHDPLRVAEEWSAVDGISGGRVAVAFASGWQPEDFVLAPERHEDKKEVMFEDIEVVRRLWRGESIEREGPDGEPVEIGTHPRPEQEELPVWITAAGSPETFRRAGEIGANVLTHLLGQSLDELTEKIESYRKARREAGHPGSGRVTVMLHAFLGEDEDAVRAAVEDPLKDYLSSSMSLIKQYADQWSAYPGKGASSEGTSGDEFEKLSDEDRQALLDHAFRRYFESGGLLGTPESCHELLEELEGAGTDEVAALVDFGVDGQQVLESLPHLAELRREWTGDSTVSGDRRGERSIPSLIHEHGVTHLQCTPSLLRLLLGDPETRRSLSRLECLMVGGETFTPDLADRALEAVGEGEVHNMYGPTETTIWSTTHRVRPGEDPVPIGRPIANTRCYVLDREWRPVPTGAEGELYIGGSGVARGYVNRPQLTGDAFLEDPFVDDSGSRMYRTGDRVRYRNDGLLEYLGRTDRQVKIRGHRVELDEIEAVLADLEDVESTAVILENGQGTDGGRISAFFVPARETATSNGERSLRLAEQVSEKAAAHLPGYMRPDRFTAVASMPLMPNGKVDRVALAEGSYPRLTGAEESSGGGTVRTETETRSRNADVNSRAAVDPAPTVRGEAGDREVTDDLKAIWRDLLDVETVASEDDFFELGGNSLLVVQLSLSIQDRFGTDVELGSIFENSSLEEMAALVEATSSSG